MAAKHEITHAVEHEVLGFPDRRLSYCNTYLTIGAPNIAVGKGTETCSACKRAIKANIVRDNTGTIISRGGVQVFSDERRTKLSEAMKARQPRGRGPLKPPPPPKVHYLAGCGAAHRPGALTVVAGEVTCLKCKKLDGEG